MSTPADPLAFFNKFLRSFVPPDSFDAHLHLYRGQDAIDGLPRSVLDEQGNASWAAYCKAVEGWMGDRRPTGGLIFTIPKPTLDMPAANQFVADEVRRLPGSRRSDDDPSARRPGHGGSHAFGRWIRGLQGVPRLFGP